MQMSVCIRLGRLRLPGMLTFQALLFIFIFHEFKKFCLKIMVIILSLMLYSNSRPN